MNGAVEVEIVPPGTEIKHIGDKLIVHDNQAVHLGNTIYMTEETYALVKAQAALET